MFNDQDLPQNNYFWVMLGLPIIWISCFWSFLCFFLVNIKKRLALKLRVIVLLHVGVVTFRFHFRKNVKIGFYLLNYPIDERKHSKVILFPMKGIPHPVSPPPHPSPPTHPSARDPGARDSIGAAKGILQGLYTSSLKNCDLGFGAYLYCKI